MFDTSNQKFLWKQSSIFFRKMPFVREEKKWIIQSINIIYLKSLSSNKYFLKTFQSFLLCYWMHLTHTHQTECRFKRFQFYQSIVLVTWWLWQTTSTVEKQINRIAVLTVCFVFVEHRLTVMIIKYQFIELEKKSMKFHFLFLFFFF